MSQLGITYYESRGKLPNNKGGCSMGCFDTLIFLISGGAAIIMMIGCAFVGDWATFREAWIVFLISMLGLTVSSDVASTKSLNSLHTKIDDLTKLVAELKQLRK